MKPSTETQRETESNFLPLNLSFRTMAISTHEGSYIKYFGRRFENLSHDSTDGDVKELYDEWAEAFDKVKLSLASSNI